MGKRENNLQVIKLWVSKETLETKKIKGVKKKTLVPNNFWVKKKSLVGKKKFGYRILPSSASTSTSTSTEAEFALFPIDPATHPPGPQDK